jgi:hypothetical protein
MEQFARRHVLYICYSFLVVNNEKRAMTVNDVALGQLSPLCCAVCHSVCPLQLQTSILPPPLSRLPPLLLSAALDPPPAAPCILPCLSQHFSESNR